MTASADKVTLQSLQQMKQNRQKSVCVVAWDAQMARIADRVGVEIVSVGDSVGVNLWGHNNPLEVTMEHMIVAGRAVRAGVNRAIVSCDFPYGPLQQGTQAAVRAAIRLAKDVAVDIVKLDGAADYPEAVEAIVKAGVPVFAQFGISPQTALHYGVDYRAVVSSGVTVPENMTAELVTQARRLEDAGASLLNFSNSGPVAGPAVVEAVSIPVLGGSGGGPWLDGRIRMSSAAIGYSAAALDNPPDTYANVAQVIFDALSEFAGDVRAESHLKGQPGRLPGT